MNRNESVRSEIVQAFSDTPYPGDDQIVAYRDDESVDLRESFKGKHWRDISREALRYHHDDLPSLSRAGLRYYLPAYLLAALDEPGVPEFILYELTPFDERAGQPLHSYLVSRFSDFSDSEKRAIRAFLELIREERADSYFRDKMEPAMRQYWSNYR
jgi:hypothetical protein